MVQDTSRISVLSVLFQLSKHHKKTYCFPSQDKICSLLKQFHGIQRSRRTLNRWLLSLESQGYIIRTRRLRRDPKRGLLFKSTLYRITKKGYRLLYAAGVDCWHMLNKLLGRKKKWPPEKRYVVQSAVIPPDPDDEPISKEEMRRIWQSRHNPLNLAV